MKIKDVPLKLVNLYFILLKTVFFNFTSVISERRNFSSCNKCNRIHSTLVFDSMLCRDFFILSLNSSNKRRIVLSLSVFLLFDFDSLSLDPYTIKFLIQGVKKEYLWLLLLKVFEFEYSIHRRKINVGRCWCK